MYSTIEKGSAFEANYRIYFKDSDGKVISPFHDIPLIAKSQDNQTLYNMVVEIPRWSQAKMEIATKERFNPIKQDVKKGKLRYVANSFPYHGYIWNYGSLPQTWESPFYEDPNTLAKGDNDPIDVCEIGTKTLSRGQVVQVKVLGVLALIDDEETDWKLIVINADDPMAAKLDDIEDAEKYMPGLLRPTFDWCNIYKIPDGKPPNRFAFDGRFMNARFAKQIIKETHEKWKTLISCKPNTSDLDLTNTSVDQSPYKVCANVGSKHLEAQPEFKDRRLSLEETNELASVYYVSDPIVLSKT